MSKFQFRADLINQEMQDKVDFVRDVGGYNTSHLVRQFFDDLYNQLIKNKKVRA